jgi:predicted nucleotidyltransferase
MKDKNIIYKITYGSHAYGTANKYSDVDIRGIYLPTLDEHLGFKEPKDITEIGAEGQDVVIFPIKKFFKLAMENNPSVLEWLYVSQKHLLLHTPTSQLIRDHRTDFLSKNVYVKFKGYAESEFRKLTKVSGKTGEKRRKQIMEIGYNPKSAMNCIRLLDQATELLTEWSLTMPLRQRELLRDIKQAKYSLKEIRSMQEEYVIKLDEAFAVTKIQDKPDREFLTKLMIDIIKTK